MKHTLSRILIAGALALFAGSALAQSTQSVTITAQVAKTCAVTAPASSITFAAAYDPNAVAPVSAAGGVGITCTKGTTYQWQILDGNWVLGGTRRLRANLGAVSDYLNYSIAASSDGGTTFTNAPVGMPAALDGAKATGRSNPMTLDLLVTLPALQDVATDLGDYTDVVDVDIFAKP